jgi:polyamine oxidase
MTSVLTYDQNGLVDYIDKYIDFETAYSVVEKDAGYILSENLQDRSFRAALNLAGYKPRGDAHAQAVEWALIDFEYAQKPVGLLNYPCP